MPSTIKDIPLLKLWMLSRSSSETTIPPPKNMHYPLSGLRSSMAFHIWLSLSVRDRVWILPSCTFADNISGVLIGTQVSSRYGRRMCMFIMSCYALITATLAVTSQHRDQILCARILNCKFNSILVICLRLTMFKISISEWSCLLFLFSNQR